MNEPATGVPTWTSTRPLAAGYGFVPEIDLTNFGHYQIGEWSYAYAVMHSGEPGEQRCGRLFHRGASLCAPVGSHLMTPWGLMTFFDDDHHSGWLPEPVPRRDH